MSFAAGTDAGAPFAPHSSLRHELILMVLGGLAIHEALLAGTRVSAEVAGLADEVGTIEPRKVADLIAVDGDRSRGCLGDQQSQTGSPRRQNRGLILGRKPPPDSHGLIGS